MSHSQDYQESVSHDALPTSMLQDDLTADKALRYLIQRGLKIAPEAKEMAYTSRGRGGYYQGGRGNRGRGWAAYRGGGNRGAPPQQRTQQKPVSAIEELSSVSASQLQISELIDEVASLKKMIETCHANDKVMAHRIDALSLEQKTATSNVRINVATLASDLGDLTNVVASMTTRRGSKADASYPTMTATELAEVSLAAKKGMNRGQEPLFKGKGVPSRAVEYMAGDTVKFETGGKKEKESAGKALKGGVLQPRSLGKGTSVTARPQAATRPPGVSTLPSTSQATSRKTPDWLSGDSAPMLIPTKVGQSIVNPAVKKTAKGKEKEEVVFPADDLLDLRTSWDLQMEEQEYEEEEEYYDEEQEQGEEEEYEEET